MVIRPTNLVGAFVVEPEILRDERGSFMRTYCERDFAQSGIRTDLVQCSEAHTLRRGTLRGLHFQSPPHEEAKLVRCLEGAVFDVAVDLRAHSPTYCQWVGLELTGENHRALYIPQGFAHGYQALSDDCRVLYQMSEYYRAEAAAGYRWDDPAFGIVWPLPDPFMSDRDRNLPLLADLRPE